MGAEAKPPPCGEAVQEGVSGLEGRGALLGSSGKCVVVRGRERLYQSPRHPGHSVFSQCGWSITRPAGERHGWVTKDPMCHTKRWEPRRFLGAAGFRKAAAPLLCPKLAFLTALGGIASCLKDRCLPPIYVCVRADTTWSLN